MRSLMRGVVWAAVGLGLMSVDMEAGAQEVLSLERALQIAEQRNPAYRQAFNSVELNAPQMRNTWLNQILPRVDLTLFTTNFTGNLTHRATDNFGNPIERPTTDWVYFSQTQQALDINWQIQGGSIFKAYDRQKLTNLDRDAAEERAFTNMEVQVRRMYMDGLEQRDLMRAEEELVEARRVDLDVAERLFGLALRTRVDVLNAELAIEQQLLALRQQLAAFEQAKLTLRTELGEDELGDFAFADEELPIFDPSGLDADAMVHTAFDVNPELRQSRLGVEGADLAVSEARTSWWPNVSMGARMTRTAQQEEKDALFDMSWDEDLDRRFYVSFSVPMFNDFFVNKANIHQAQIEVANQREAEREVRLRVEGTVRSAVLELDNQYESLRLVERAGEIAQEALRLAREEYRIGARTFEDLQSAFDQEADTRRQVITSRHSFIDALLSLEEAVGARVGPFGPMAGGR